MDAREKTKKILLSHLEKYPLLQPSDVLKLLHQSAFGCEHLISSPENVTRYIKEEYESLSENRTEEPEPLDGNFLRVPLSYMNRGLAPETLGRLFFLSAEKKTDGKEALLEKAEAVKELAQEGALPFSREEFCKAFSNWQENGFPALHHSDMFRNAYKPAYRVISKDFAHLLPLLAETDKMLKKGRVRLAIEGGAASGKTTLAQLLSRVYDCTVLHTDDFFLQKHQRTPERLAEIGGNLDRERFSEEVLLPLSQGRDVLYRRFDCSEMKLLPPERISPRPLTVIEGSYSLHPDFRQFYDLTVFLSISPEEQKRRITARNTPETAERFFKEWIPMENAYFNTMHPQQICSFVFSPLP